jgi:hypothetical protein
MKQGQRMVTLLALAILVVGFDVAAEAQSEGNVAIYNGGSPAASTAYIDGGLAQPFCPSRRCSALVSPFFGEIRVRIPTPALTPPASISLDLGNSPADNIHEDAVL